MAINRIPPPGVPLVDSRGIIDAYWWDFLSGLADTITKSPGLVLISSQVANNSSQIIFTGMTNAYDAYQFHITGLRPSVDNVILRMQMSVNGGATWKDTANNWTWLYSFIAGGATPYGHNQNAEGSTAYFRIGGNTSTAWGNLSEVMVYPNSGGNLNSATWRSLDYWAGGGGTYQVIGAGGEHSDATPLNAVRFFFAAGNIISGRISMYGLRKP